MNFTLINYQLQITYSETNFLMKTLMTGRTMWPFRVDTIYVVRIEKISKFQVYVFYRELVSTFRTSERSLQLFWELLKIKEFLFIFKNFRKIFRHGRVAGNRNSRRIDINRIEKQTSSWFTILHHKRPHSSSGIRAVSRRYNFKKHQDFGDAHMIQESFK